MFNFVLNSFYILFKVYSSLQFQELKAELKTERQYVSSPLRLIFFTKRPK